VYSKNVDNKKKAICNPPMNPKMNPAVPIFPIPSPLKWGLVHPSNPRMF
jgi:hypothetical protein